MLDLRSLVFSNFLSSMVCALVMAVLWTQNRKQFSGVGFWLADFILQIAALALIAARGFIPDVLSIVLANAMAIAGAWLGLVGLERFAGLRSHPLPNLLAIAALVPAQAWFNWIQPDQAVRDLNFSLGLLFMSAQCVWLWLVRARGRMRRLVLGPALVFLLYALVSVARIAEFFAVPHAGNDYMHSGGFNQGVMLAYQTAFILLTCALALMFNKRLQLDIAASEAKFSSAFHSSPWAILISRLGDGVILEVNQGFQRLTGYRPADVLGRSTGSLGVWRAPGDQAELQAELERSGRIAPRVVQLRNQDGELRQCQLSGEVIMVAGEPCLLSSVEDITDRLRNEQDLQATTLRLQALVKEKEIILQEVHHRIKNNMVTVQGLLLMQSNGLADPAARAIIQDASNRIQSMLLLYDRLYRNEYSGTLSLAAYVPPLVDEIVRNFPVQARVTVRKDIADIPLDANAVSILGLIINEMITNAMKYAAVPGRDTTIAINIRAEGERIVLDFRDDGPGLPENLDLAGLPGFGLKLIGLLAAQLYGELHIGRQPGTSYTLAFRPDAVKPRGPAAGPAPGRPAPPPPPR